MPKIDYDAMTRSFLLNEEHDSPDTLSYIQAITEILNRMNPHSIRESRNIAVMKSHLKEIGRGTKRMMAENRQLQERLTVLEEEKEK